MQKIGIIGSGIAGMGCGFYLHSHFDISILERNDYIGGHTFTWTVKQNEKMTPVDMGFMVFNYITYPNLTKLFNKLGVVAKKTRLTCSITDQRESLSYSVSSWRGGFAQKKNLFRPTHYKLLLKIRKFGRMLAKDINGGSLAGLTLQDYCNERGFDRNFVEHFLFPVCSATWNLKAADVPTLPAELVISSLRRHDMLQLHGKLDWYTVHRGSWQYRDKVTESFHDRIRTGSPVAAVEPFDGKVKVRLKSGEELLFDHVIMACHADEALALLSQPTALQRELLSCFQYQDTIAALHSDSSVMPGQRSLWNAWNVKIDQVNGETRYTTHFYMNLLQKMSKRDDLFVSINDPGNIHPDRIITTHRFRHPIFTTQTMKAQSRLAQLNKEGRIYFCGSYFNAGHHEDALASAVKLCEQLVGKKLESNWGQV